MSQILELLKWYHSMGVDDIISNSENIEVDFDTLNLSLNKKQTISTKFNQDYKMTSKDDIISYTRNIVNECNNIEDLHQALLNFDGCLLKKTATNTVFSDGNISSEIMIIGEAPGANEDIQSIPFCGDSGKLLDNMLSYIGLDRKQNIYITNAVFWRPPGNRKPSLEEISICKPFLERHIALFNPKLIILAGSTAVSAILGINEPMSKIRQKTYQYSNCYLNDSITTVAMFHPSYLLRQPSQKKLVWLDLLKIRKYLKENNIINN